MFWLTYKNLISAWTGSAQYAGDTIMHLLVANFFFGLIGYFMSNMGYALGDIKMNSVINIVRGILLATSIFLVAGPYGIPGTLIATLSVILVTDFFYFTYRLYKLGYLQPILLKNILSMWVIIVPLAALAGWACKGLVENIFAENEYIPKLVVSGGLFCVTFIALLLLFDDVIRGSIKVLRNKIIISPFYKILKA
jgi:hypothetical protein